MERNNAYDIAKCWAIVSVIIYHVINIIFFNQIIHSFIDTYFLTLFFFISGLLTRREKVSRATYVKQQTIHLLVPFFAVFILYRVFQHFASGFPIVSSQAFDDSKSGFWFIFSLYCFCITLKLLQLVLNRVKNRWVHIILLTAPFIVVVALCSVLPYEVAGYFSLMSFRRYWLFFIYGYIVSNYLDYKRLISNKAVIYFALPVYIILAAIYIVKVRDVESNLDFAIWFITNFAGCHFWLALFEYLKKPLSNSVVLGIGRSTLGIYLLHYFPLLFAKSILGSGYLLTDNGLYILYALITVLTILALSYFLTWIVRRNRVTAFIFLGEYNKTQ